MSLFACGVLSLLVTQSWAAIAEHEITSLPGWTGPLPSKMYSGYIPTGTTSGVKGYIHYWFIESQQTPSKDPVVYWTNGGPGGSGINAGLLTEMGVFHLNENSLDNDGMIHLLLNDYAWSTQANMLYVSQPKGVGFSYCDIPDDEDCVNNDVIAAQDAYDFFVNFFAAYPEFADNDFYLTAESYGGIYLPMFMDEIDRRGGINLKGAAIGDGCWGTSVGTCNFTSGKSNQISVEFYQGHGMYDQTLYKAIKQACGEFSDESVLKPECSKLLDAMSDKIGSFDIYNIYDTCAGDTDFTHRDLISALSQQTVIVDDPHSSALHPQLKNMVTKGGLGGALNDYPCGGDSTVSKWLAGDGVAKALHVKAGTKGMKYNWGPYNVSGDLRPLYKRLAQKYRIMIYSGDTDACVPYWGTQEWVRELGFPVRKDWRPWLSAHLTRAPQRAGYVIDYDSGGTGFRFVTVQGAGHLVPTYKPHFALTMITKFLKNEEF